MVSANTSSTLVYPASEAEWDVVAFVVKDKLVAPLFVELSGGIGFNASKGKESGE
ncbi:hypothetical protein CU097_006340, partial [Rhizopus azygosporus]